MAACTIASEPSIQTSGERFMTHRVARQHGLTLVELLIAMSVAGIILVLILPLVLGNRRVVQNDQLRTGVNQTLRAANDLLAADIRIAAERFGLGLGLSPIELSVDGAGNSILTLRRNLEDALPVCAPVTGSQTTIQVAVWGSTTYPQCGVTRTVTDPATTVAWPETMYQHKERLDEAGGTRLAYIYDPANGIGQWFPMSMAGTATPQPDDVQCAPPPGVPNACSWNSAANYAPSASGLFPYIAQIEETVYRVVNGVLEKVDGGSGQVLRIASGIDRFQVAASFSDGTTSGTVSGTANNWRSITSLDLDMAVTLDEGPAAVQRELQTSLFPRNLLSR